MSAQIAEDKNTIIEDSEEFKGIWKDFKSGFVGMESTSKRIQAYLRENWGGPWPVLEAIFINLYAESGNSAAALIVKRFRKAFTDAVQAILDEKGITGKCGVAKLGTSRDEKAGKNLKGYTCSLQDKKPRQASTPTLPTEGDTPKGAKTIKEHLKEEFAEAMKTKGEEGVRALKATLQNELALLLDLSIKKLKGAKS